MNESENVWENDIQFWNFVGENKKLVGIPVSEGQGLDILNALRDVYLTIDDNKETAMSMLTMLGTFIYASSIGEGEKYTNEIQVLSAMENFDRSMKEILDEKPK